MSGYVPRRSWFTDKMLGMLRSKSQCGQVAIQSPYQKAAFRTPSFYMGMGFGEVLDEEPGGRLINHSHPCSRCADTNYWRERSTGGQLQYKGDTVGLQVDNF
jgi:hypothetical protein